MKVDWKKRALDTEKEFEKHRKEVEKFRNGIVSQLELIVWFAKEQNFGIVRDRAEYLLNRVQRHQTIER